MNRYYNPVRTVLGRGCVSRLPEILEEMEPEKGRILFLMWNEKALPEEIFFRLKDFQVKTMTFEASNPTVEQLYKTYEQTRGFSPDVVVAVGGGSIMDVGKSLCCLYGKEIPDADALRALIQSGSYGTPHTRWVGIPTTAGTGSEVTCWATIWDPEKDAKRSVENHENYACAALVDP